MKKEFMVNRQGKEFVLYAGLLDQAHREGLKRISTSLIQAPADSNGHLAICHAEVETEKGIFSGIGDASPENVGRMIAPHTIRMAETRAKARALRDAINVGVTALEELGDVEEDSSINPPARRPAVRPMAALARPTPTPVRAEPHAVRETVATGDDASPPATQQQIDRLHKLQAALGQAAMVSSTMTSEEAAARISELVRQFNTQSRQAGRAQAR
ncbi:MAG TPA: hypothetical protein VNL35_19575 [Chloroflexota bacterium]|nr:hypothetical protein [Chloroflexota bacterium]